MKITGLIAPLSSSGHTLARSDWAIAVLKAIGLGRKVEPVELVADRDLAKNLLNIQKGFSTHAFCPYSFPTGKMRNSNE